MCHLDAFQRKSAGLRRPQILPDLAPLFSGGDCVPGFRSMSPAPERWPRRPYSGKSVAQTFWERGSAAAGARPPGQPDHPASLLQHLLPGRMASASLWIQRWTPGSPPNPCNHRAWGFNPDSTSASYLIFSPVKREKDYEHLAYQDIVRLYIYSIYLPLIGLYRGKPLRNVGYYYLE